jgi:hypothetical protein
VVFVAESNPKAFIYLLFYYYLSMVIGIMWVIVWWICEHINQFSLNNVHINCFVAYIVVHWLVLYPLDFLNQNKYNTIQYNTLIHIQCMPLWGTM